MNSKKGSVMTEQKLPGKNFIFVPSILSLMGVVLNVILFVPQLLTSADLDAAWPIFIPWRVWHSFVLISSAYTLFLSISGIRFCNVLEKAEFLFTLGIISITIAGIVLIFNLIVIGINVAVLVGPLLPVLYLIGAQKNKQYRAI